MDSLFVFWRPALGTGEGHTVFSGNVGTTVLAADCHHE